MMFRVPLDECLGQAIFSSHLSSRQDLTEQARERKLDPVIGRENEVRRTITVLSRRTKNNPLLVGT